MTCLEPYPLGMLLNIFPRIIAVPQLIASLKINNHPAPTPLPHFLFLLFPPCKGEMQWDPEKLISEDLSSEN